MAKIHSVSVRTLAEFAFEHGDLISSAKAAASMRDGVRGHQMLQEMLPVNWRPEVPVSRDISLNGHILRVHGRADAIYLNKDTVHILEIKTTTRNPTGILKYDFPSHWAQGEIYAALFCLNTGATLAEVRLIYARLDGMSREYVENYNTCELQERLMTYARPYLDWISRVDDWKEISKFSLEGIPFPFERYREGQYEMAKQVYHAMKRHSNVLIEAPTGIGKTAASLYGALKALGKGHITTIFYLTARTTGRQAAEAALDHFRGMGLMIRSLTIIAKEKACLMEEMDCDACPYATGYYDRRREALKRAMCMQKADADAVLKLAAEYELCPFELSLDISETSDVIICDYNYVFDPKVRLKRYFDTKSKAGLLVDEAHNMVDRAQEMFSAQFSGKHAWELRTKLVGFEGKDSPMVRLLDELLHEMDEKEAELECTTEPPKKILEAARRFTEIAIELERSEPDIMDFLYDMQWFVRVAKQYDTDCYRTLIVPGEKWLTLRLWCFAPSKYLNRVFSRIGGTALFSGTLAPMGFYMAQLGLNREEDTCLQLDSPFPRENLCVLRMSVPVGLKDRGDTINTVVQIIHTMVQSKIGNYIACFPSYEYMSLAYRRYRLLWTDTNAMCQARNMSEQERLKFISNFTPSPQESMIAFVVLGGVFAEGVDLPEERLSGAAIISTGFPQIGFEREQLRELLNDADEDGYDAAYVYPGMRRVLQAAGRVIRSETDRGVVLLIDSRFRQEKYRTLLPPHWEVKDIKKMSILKNTLIEFWNSKAQ